VSIQILKGVSHGKGQSDSGKSEEALRCRYPDTQRGPRPA
jgi:hypothetical protein